MERLLTKLRQRFYLQLHRVRLPLILTAVFLGLKLQAEEKATDTVPSGSEATESMQTENEKATTPPESKKTAPVKKVFTLHNLAVENGFLIAAEQVILETPVPPIKGPIVAQYLPALCEAHGWELKKFPGSESIFSIHAPDLAKTQMVPMASLSPEELETFRSSGMETLKFNNVLYVRAPSGLDMPEILRPKPLFYQVLITKYSREKLLNLSFDFRRTLLEAERISLGGPFDPISLLDLFELDITNGAVVDRYALHIEGTTSTPAQWEQKESRNFFIESRNFDDSRIATDREEIEAGKSFQIEPIGDEFFRIRIEDTDLIDTGVQGLIYTSDIDLSKGYGSLMISSTEETKRKSFFKSRRKSESTFYHLIEIRVSPSAFPRKTLTPAALKVNDNKPIQATPVKAIRAVPIKKPVPEPSKNLQIRRKPPLGVVTAELPKDGAEGNFEAPWGWYLTEKPKFHEKTVNAAALQN
jgi:hypothetical protein